MKNKHTRRSQATQTLGRNTPWELVLQLFLLRNGGMRMAQTPPLAPTPPPWRGHPETASVTLGHPGRQKPHSTSFTRLRPGLPAWLRAEGTSLLRRSPTSRRQLRGAPAPALPRSPARPLPVHPTHRTHTPAQTLTAQRTHRQQKTINHRQKTTTPLYTHREYKS